MHLTLFANQRALTPGKLLLHGQAIGLEVSKFRQCLESSKHAAKVRKDLADGRQAGVTGTPAFFLGITEPNDTKVKALRALKGAQPYARFKEVIDSLLTP